ncbi:MAG: c-type cytochrome [Flavobacteriaceae bacterium]|nr:c-type cytochrome [Flavobacteriaceae bacterium]
MKKVLLAFTVLAMFLTSCGDDKKKEVKKEVETKVEEVKSDVAVADDQLALGEKLFAEKTCVSCHQMDAKVVGPSIKDMATIYKEKNGNFVQFLKGNDAAIVDTDPGQVAIMKANLDGFVKDMNGDELQALAAYMRNAIK